MKPFIIALLALVSTNALAAPKATIACTDPDNARVTFALDAEGTPRIDGKGYPTIKDFRDYSDYTDVCYTGAVKDMKALLSALVEAANGDGDSWAELNTIKSTKKGVITVVATITDEGGESEESYSFNPCK